MKIDDLDEASRVAKELRAAVEQSRRHLGDSTLGMISGRGDVFGSNQYSTFKSERLRFRAMWLCLLSFHEEDIRALEFGLRTAGVEFTPWIAPVCPIDADGTRRVSENAADG